MEPILFIHGYSSEGKNKSPRQIYGQLPKLLKQTFGRDTIQELDLSRWISLEDGITLNDVSFAMDRAPNKEFPHLLASSINVIIHSTGTPVTYLYSLYTKTKVTRPRGRNTIIERRTYIRLSTPIRR